MQALPNYLTKRVSSGIYHFRIRIPVNIQRMTGKKEIHKSLKTREPRQARILGSAILEAVERLFKQLEGDSKPMNKKSVLARLGIDGDPTELVKIGDITIDRPELSALEEIQLAKELAQSFGVQVSSNQPKSIEPVIEKPAETPKGPRLSQVYEQYKIQKSGKWSNKTRDTYDNQYATMFALLGDPEITKINREGAINLMKVLSLYPSNANKLPRFKDKNPLEIYGMNIAARNPAETLSGQSVNLYLQKMHTLFEFAVINEMAVKNPFIKLALEVKKKRARREFTKAEISLIFSDEIFKNSRYSDPYQYWLPLLGYFTGARLNELCGLALSDVSKENGIDILFINEREEEGHTLKNEVSIRKIPVHPKLVELGFIDYCEKRKKAGKHLVFDLNQNKYGSFIQIPSAWFNRFLTRIKIKEKEICFHSWRHTLQNILQNSAISAEFRSAYMGHSLGDGAENDGGSRTTIDVYGTTYPPEILLEKVTPFLPFDFDVKPYVAK